MKSLAHLSFVFIFAGVAEAQQPVTLTTTADFQRGNDEGGVSPAQDRVTRAPIAAGAVGAWNPGTPLSAALDNTGAVAHNGFAYVVGGRDLDFNRVADVRYATLAANGDLGAWTSTTALPVAVANHASVAYNNFVYAIGGIDFD